MLGQSYLTKRSDKLATLLVLHHTRTHAGSRMAPASSTFHGGGHMTRNQITSMLAPWQPPEAGAKCSQKARGRSRQQHLSITLPTSDKSAPGRCYTWDPCQMSQQCKIPNRDEKCQIVSCRSKAGCVMALPLQIYRFPCSIQLLLISWVSIRVGWYHMPQPGSFPATRSLSMGNQAGYSWSSFRNFTTRYRIFSRRNIHGRQRG